MAAQIPPEIERPPEDERARDEGGLASVVRVILTAFAFILLLPPWGFIVWFYSVKIVAEYERGVIFRLGRLVATVALGLEERADVVVVAHRPARVGGGDGR